MRAIEILSEEHQVILQALDGLEGLAREAESTGRLDAGAARDAVDFFRHYADGVHHAKEEHQLFPKMVELGESTEHGPMALFIEEHVKGREAVRAMESCIEPASAGDAEALARFVAVARDHAGLLRDHAAREDEALFPELAELLSDDDDWELVEAYQRADAELEPGVQERCLAIARRLAQRFGGG